MPLPVPTAVMVSHVALLVAVQLQKVGAVTVTVPVIPAEVALADAREIVGTHGAAACVTVKVFPPIVSVPVRGVAAAFAATV